MWFEPIKIKLARKEAEYAETRRLTDKCETMMSGFWVERLIKLQGEIAVLKNMGG